MLVVEILNNKANYNTLELTSGRMAKVVRGDIVVGALGHRKALFGYSGHIPADAQTRRRHSNAEHRRRARHLRFGDAGQGQALRLQGVGHGADFSLSRRAHRRARQGGIQGLGLRRGARTRAACRSWRSPALAWRRARLPPPPPSSRACAIADSIVDAFKATGVSLRRDIMAFEDSGARRTMLFTDLGMVTTTAKCGPALTRTMLTEMAAGPTGRHRVRIGRWPAWEPMAWNPSCASPTSRRR